MKLIECSLRMIQKCLDLVALQAIKSNNLFVTALPSNDWYFATMKASKLRLTHWLLRLTINFSIATPSRFFVSRFCKKISSTSLRSFASTAPWKVKRANLGAPQISRFRRWFTTFAQLRECVGRELSSLDSKLTFYHDYGLVSGHASTCTRGPASIRTKSKSKGKKGAGDAAVVSQV